METGFGVDIVVLALKEAVSDCEVGEEGRTTQQYDGSGKRYNEFGCLVILLHYFY